MSEWRDREWKEAWYKLTDGMNTYLFLDEGKVKDGGKYGDQVVFRVTPIGPDGPEGSGNLGVGSVRLIEQLKKIKNLTGHKIKITKSGTGYDTNYVVKDDGA